MNNIYLYFSHEAVSSFRLIAAQNINEADSKLGVNPMKVVCTGLKVQFVKLKPKMTFFFDAENKQSVLKVVDIEHSFNINIGTVADFEVFKHSFDFYQNRFDKCFIVYGNTRIALNKEMLGAINVE